MVRIMLSRKLGELRVNQAELSRMTGISSGKINALYHEMDDRVSLDYLDKTCDALNCDLSDILIREPNPTPRIVADRVGNPIE